MSTHEHHSTPSDEPFTQQSSLQIEVRIRHDLQGAADRIEDVLSRLERLDDQDHIESYTLVGWGCQACAPVDTLSKGPIRPRSIVQATIADFNKWATQQGYSLGPAFGQPADNAAGEPDGQIDVPIICLAAYDREHDTNETDDPEQLVAVYPCVDEEGDVKTVENGLSALEEHAQGQ